MILKWIPTNNADLGFFHELSNAIAEYEKLYPRTFPDLRQNSMLILASDYSGEAKYSRFDALAFLILNRYGDKDWRTLREEVRQQYLRDSRTISYKKLSDERRRQALLPFLEAANSIDGLITVILIDKQIGSLFESEARRLPEDPKLAPYAHWNAKVLEKALRITNLVSCFISGLAQSGQDLLWISDEDDTVPNDQRLQEFTNMFVQTLESYGRVQLEKVDIVTTRADMDNQLLEDLAAIPDLVAGTLVHLLDEWAELIDALRLGVHIPVPERLQPKTRQILKWLEDEEQPLKRCFMVFDQTPGSVGLNVLTLRLYTEHLAGA
jgi:hypothetical protein